MSTTRSYPATLAVPAASRTQADSDPIRVRDVFAAVIEQVMVWHDRVRQRRQLHSLNDHMLRDLGLGRADVAAETSKRFWQP